MSLLLLKILLPILYDYSAIYLVLIVRILDGTSQHLICRSKGGMQSIGHNFKHLFIFLASIFLTNIPQSVLIFNNINILSKE